VGEKSEIEEKAYYDKWGKGLDNYLQMIYERLILMKELLAENGSIYVHLDWHVGHYVKVMMDEIFGYENFRNEIVWHYGLGGSSAQNWPLKHDCILFYSKGNDWVYNPILVPATSQRMKGELKKMDNVWDIPSINNMALERVAFDTQKPEALLKRIILASSNPGDIVADFFCGSGTTLAVAEKLGRRWIGCDSSIHAINTTKKRLLEIEKSKDLMNKNNLYGKKARPFEILTLDSYERKYWQVKTFKDISDCIAFILNAYGAEPILDYTYLRGKKENALVYVGDLDSPITIQNLINAVKECKQAGGQELHILGWEWEMSLNTVIQDIAEREGIIIKPRIIPRDIMNREAVKNIRFFELSYFNVDIEIEGNQLQVELKDFIIPHKDLIPNSIKDKIEKWTDWVDYWAIDFDYKENIFNNNWTSYRTKKDRTLTLKATYKYNNPGRYKICVKVTDIFGIDTSQLFEIEIK
jgi:adenine-specific DNA-methyltransferase